MIQFFPKRNLCLFLPLLFPLCLTVLLIYLPPPLPLYIPICSQTAQSPYALGGPWRAPRGHTQKETDFVQRNKIINVFHTEKEKVVMLARAVSLCPQHAHYPEWTAEWSRQADLHWLTLMLPYRKFNLDVVREAERTASRMFCSKF